MSCGLTHLAVTPLDVVKCNMQTNSAKYSSIGKGFGIVVAEEGIGGLVRGWLPTLIGYSAQVLLLFPSSIDDCPGELGKGKRERERQNWNKYTYMFELC